MKDYSKRIKHFQKLVQKGKIEAFLVENPLDLYYLTGLSLSTGSLLVFSTKAELYVDGRYLQVCQEKSPVPAFLASEKMGEKLKSIGFDAETMTYARFTKLKKRLALKPWPNLLKEIRSIKDAGELKLLKKAADIGWKGLKHIQRHLKTGVSEKELALHFELFCLKEGAEGMAFEPIIAFGKNSALPHHRASETKLKKGDLVLCDLGVIYKKYRSDMTRILHFGTIDPRLARMERVVRKAHAAVLMCCRSGAIAKDLDLAARRVMRKEEMEELFVHSLGHGVGLSTHEFPRIAYYSEDKDAVLKEGMVITIEPGLYLPGVGGVRYEDTILITEKGYTNFYV